MIACETCPFAFVVSIMSKLDKILKARRDVANNWMGKKKNICNFVIKKYNLRLLKM